LLPNATTQLHCHSERSEESPCAIWRFFASLRMTGWMAAPKQKRPPGFRRPFCHSERSEESPCAIWRFFASLRMTGWMPRPNKRGPLGSGGLFVTLSAAKSLASAAGRFFAPLRMTSQMVSAKQKRPPGFRRPFCHSERNEESRVRGDEILRCPQNDRDGSFATIPLCGKTGRCRSSAPCARRERA